MRPTSPADRLVRRRPACFAVAAVLLVLVGAVGPVRQASGAPTLLGMRSSSTEMRTRIVLDLSGPAPASLSQVGTPPRLIVDLAGVDVAREQDRRLDDGRVAEIRTRAVQGTARLTVMLAGDVRHRSFTLPAADGRPERFVLDVSTAPPASTAAAPAAIGAVPVVEEADSLVVVIDPGHGGRDPGAIHAGLREKDITLDVARRLARLLADAPAVRPVLTRDSDRKLGLAERVGLAEGAGGDIFVSIHVNSADDAGVRGMEVFYLDPDTAAEVQARVGADPDRARDLLGLTAGTRLADGVLPVLLDLRRRAAATASRGLAERILAEARRHVGLQARLIKQDEYHVLQTLAMPGVLVETAYLSNPADRAVLASGRGRQELANVLAEAVLSSREGPSGGATDAEDIWATWYHVRAGDNLWGLARRHGTSVDRIVRRNHLESEVLAVGQTLNLP